MYSCTENAGNNVVPKKDPVNAAASANPGAIDKLQPNGDFDMQKSEVLEEKHLLFNDKLKRFFQLNEFTTVFGEPDSIHAASAEGRCNYIFEKQDGETDYTGRYFYKQGSRFENADTAMAVDLFKFTKENFIRYRGILLNAETSLDDLKKLFPYAAAFRQTVDYNGENKLERIQLREDAENISDGHINLYIKENKLYLLEWWFPC